VEAQILDAATELFAARGYAGTSLQDVASAA
jgi:AcrR family transcriptional regulator